MVDLHMAHDGVPHHLDRLCRYPVRPAPQSTSMQCERDTYSGIGILECVCRYLRFTSTHSYGLEPADVTSAEATRIWSFRFWAAVSDPRVQRLASEYSLTAFRGVATSLARAAILTDPQSFASGFRWVHHFTSRLTVISDGGGIAFACWSTAEAAVALLCACLPILRPLCTDMYHKLVSTCRSRYPLQSSAKRGLQKPKGIPKAQTYTMSSSASGDARSEVWGLNAARDEEGRLGS